MTTALRLVGAEDALPSKLSINVEGTVPDMVRAVLPALAKCEIYQRAGRLVHVVSEPLQNDEGEWIPNGALHIRDVPKQLLKNELNGCAHWFELDKNSEHVTCEVPPDVVTTVHQAGEWAHIRPLKGIANWPVLRPNYTLATEDGYDPGTRFLLRGLPATEIPHNPTQADAAAAAKELLLLGVPPIRWTLSLCG